MTYLYINSRIKETSPLLYLKSSETITESVRSYPSVIYRSQSFTTSNITQLIWWSHDKTMFSFLW